MGETILGGNFPGEDFLGEVTDRGLSTVQPSTCFRIWYWD